MSGGISLKNIGLIHGVIHGGIIVFSCVDPLAVFLIEVKHQIKAESTFMIILW